ncbi:MAG: hypothetical protein ACFFBX_09305 [Promethearchaeota archaeon]
MRRSSFGGRRRFLRRRRRRVLRRTFRRIAIGTTMIFLMAGTASTIKLHRRDVERIEEDTGKSTKNMTEAELVAAMKRLGIKKLEITPEDQEMLSEHDID